MPYTPGPWQHRPNIGICAPDGREIARTIVTEPNEKSDYEEAWANARFIIRACNTHADLLEACEMVAEAITYPPHADGSVVRLTQAEYNKLTAAIAKATKEESCKRE